MTLVTPLPSPNPNDKPSASRKFEQFRENMSEPLGELWDNDALLAENFMNLFKQAIILPEVNIQLPVLTAYVFIPSALATVVPLLYFQGDRGSGKSNAGVLIEALHDCEIKSAATTFAGLRNYFNKLRWECPEFCEGEKNCCLILDNVSHENLLNDNLYTFFLNGYNRKTDAISISKGNGENIEFKVFGLKVLSSIHPFYTESKFGELTRRCLVVKFKPFERMTLLEKQSAGIDDHYNIAERLELDGLDLSILSTEFKAFWDNDVNLITYMDIKRKLVSRKKSFAIPDSIDGSKWTISIDLIATGVTTKIWDSIPEAVEAIGKYWEWYRLNIASAMGVTHKFLQDFIEQEVGTAKRTNNELGYEAVPLEINTEKLKKHITWGSSQGMLDVTPTPQTIASVMTDLGWGLDKNKRGQMCWMLLSK